MTATIIIALDFPSEKKALQFVECLDPMKCKLKVGLEMYTAFGQRFVQQLMVMGFDIFLDLKLHDIPNTVAAACRKIAELDVWMTNVHAFGGPAMMHAAKQAIDAVGSKTALIAVTVLTSHQQSDMPLLGIQNSIDDQVAQLALLAHDSGLDGIVCSAREVAILKQSYGLQKFMYVTPGIRPLWAVAGDQQRIMTPSQAQAIGIQYLVIGRPITDSDDPMAAFARICDELI